MATVHLLMLIACLLIHALLGIPEYFNTEAGDFLRGVRRGDGPQLCMCLHRLPALACNVVRCEYAPGSIWTYRAVENGIVSYHVQAL